MKLAWNLFLKDQSVLRWWLVAWLGSQVLYVVVNYIEWATGTIGLLASLSLLISSGICIVLVVLLVQLEPVNVGVDFWKTRPLRPGQLLLGKVLFIGLYLVLLPWIARTVLLCLTGHLGYLPMAWLEWACGHFFIGLIAFAMAIISRQVGHAFAWTLAVLAFGTLLNAAITLAKGWFQWAPEIAPWWDYPSAPIIAMIIVALGASAVILNQYVTGHFKRSIGIISLTVVLISVLDLLPLRPNAPVYTRPYPGSNARLEAAARALEPELARLCPLALEIRTGSGYNDLHLMEVQRAFPTERFSIDQRSMRLRLPDRTIRSDQFPRNQLEWRRSRAFFREAVGEKALPPALPSRTWGEDTLLEIDERYLEAVSGTLSGEVSLEEAQPSMLINLPLVKGNTFRKGPFRLVIDDVEMDSDGVRLVLALDLPRRRVTRPWEGIPRDGISSNDLRLYHRPTKTLVAFGGSSGRDHTKSWAIRYTREWTLKKPSKSRSADFSPSLFAEANINLNDWSLVVASSSLAASKRVPFEIPGFQLQRSVPQSMEALRSQLEDIQREGFASTETYLWKVFGCWSHDLLNVGHPEVEIAYAWVREKLASLESEDVPALVAVGRRLTGHYWMGAAELTLEAINRLARPEHKELLLAHHDVNFNLLTVIERHGWETDALPIMIAKSNRREVPRSWKTFLEQHQPDAVPMTSLEARWDRRKDRGEMKPLMEEMLASGSDSALRNLRYVVKAADAYVRQEPQELVAFLATISECPPELSEARRWLEAHAETAVFDPDTRRYTINPQKKETL